MTKFIRQTMDLTGILQGVGFRPSLARLARQDELGGWVRNQSGTVRLSLDGEEAKVDAFVTGLANRLPPQARLESIREISRETIEASDIVSAFAILESEVIDSPRISIPADLVMCEDCRTEVKDPNSRYFGYPFTTCTNCGPRYTVVDGMPYDRDKTTLREFPLCEKCLDEYSDENNRRFHAQSIACPDCGPQLAFFDAAGEPVDGDPLRLARRVIRDGKILAVKGIGGYLLTGDAFCSEALIALRTKKRRPAKPFAVMARNMDVAAQYCQIDKESRKLLESVAAPIVVLNKLKTRDSDLPVDLLAPGTGTLGMMLPTTPLHMLLAEPLNGDPTGSFDLLLMTSGNRGGEPICITNEEAFDRLSGIADFFLTHNRSINLRNDDSLCVSVAGAPRVWRRARGYAPNATILKRPLKKKVLAMGAEIKNTIAVGCEDRVILSPHIGDLETPEALDGLEGVTRRFPEYFDIEPEIVAVDLHPDMRSVRLGKDLAASRGIAVQEVQHHHAHVVACMAEFGLEEALGLVYDGTGLGDDGAIWGAELLHVTPSGFRRLATFEGSPLPGGDAAVKNPARQLIARFLGAEVSCSKEWLDRLHVTSEQVNIWKLQCDRGLNAPVTHAAGRLFDSVSMALGVSPPEVSYEGQAAILLEAVATKFRGSSKELGELPFSIREKNNLWVVDWSSMFARFASAPPSADDTVQLAASFHDAVIRASQMLVLRGVEATQCKSVVLSGGVMMNRLISESLLKHLNAAKLEVFLPRDVPPNDGGISLGQAVIAGG